MEIASAVAANAASVTVISSTPEPLPAFGTDVGAAIRKVRQARLRLYQVAEKNMHDLEMDAAACRVINELNIVAVPQ